jgi:hypothetical protein
VDLHPQGTAILSRWGLLFPLKPGAGSSSRELPISSVRKRLSRARSSKSPRVATILGPNTCARHSSSRIPAWVPINLPPDHKTEALALGDKLLLFRFRNFRKRPALSALVDRTLEPRLNQISCRSSPSLKTKKLGRNCEWWHANASAK